MLKCVGLSLLAVLILAGSAAARETDGDDGPGNDTEVLQLPQPTYPLLAAVFGLEGVCEVRFDVLEYGDYVEVRQVSCSHPVFCEEARESVRRARFRVTDVEGTMHPGERHNVVYPLAFRLSEASGRPQSWPPMMPCTADLVS